MSGFTTAVTYQLSFSTILDRYFGLQGRQWELSYRSGMRPWIFVALQRAAFGRLSPIFPDLSLSARGSFSDAMPLASSAPLTFIAGSPGGAQHPDEPLAHARL